MKYVLSLDLGKMSDPTAYTLTEKTIRQWREYSHNEPGYELNRNRRHTIYHLLDIYRPPLGTSYIDIALDVSRRMQHPLLEGQCDLVIDATGVGRPVLEIMEKIHNLSPVGIVITGGHSVTKSEDGLLRVPKIDLVTNGQLILQSKRLVIADVALAPLLRTELQQFVGKNRSVSGIESFEAWRERDTDDIVLSLLQGLWVHEVLGGGVAVPSRAQKNRSGYYDPLRRQVIS